MKAILIDSFTQEVKQVEYNGDFNQINQLIGSECFCIGSYFENGDVVFVDDEGLLKDPTHFFVTSTYPNPLAGRGLVVGTGKQGESKGCESTVEEIKKSIRFEDINTVAFKAKLGAYK